MSLRFMSATLSVATLLLIGCDTTQYDSPDPDVTPARSETQIDTQPPVTDREYISPDAALPRPESPRQPEYPIGQPSADSPATSTPPSPSTPDATQPAPRQQPTATGSGSTAPAATTEGSTEIDNPAVEEVPADSPPAQD